MAPAPSSADNQTNKNKKKCKGFFRGKRKIQGKTLKNKEEKNCGRALAIPNYVRLNFLQNSDNLLMRAGAHARIMADWTRGKVICRFAPGRASFGPLRFAPGLGKACILL